MAKVINLSMKGSLKLTTATKHAMAHIMYSKGKSFLASAILLEKQNGDKSVTLHLLCQGIEIILKGILLKIDYDKYKPKLRKCGHKLVEIAELTTSASNLKPLNKHIKQELEGLNNHYSYHRFRYASTADILINIDETKSDKVWHRISAMVRLIERKNLIPFTL